MGFKQQISTNIKTTKVVWNNATEFIDAACLAGVSAYAIYESLQQNHKSFWYRTLLLAGCLIAIQAFVLLVKHFNKPLDSSRG